MLVGHFRGPQVENRCIREASLMADRSENPEIRLCWISRWTKANTLITCSKMNTPIFLILSVVLSIAIFLLVSNTEVLYEVGSKGTCGYIYIGDHPFRTSSWKGEGYHNGGVPKTSLIKTYFFYHPNPIYF